MQVVERGNGLGAPLRHLDERRDKPEKVPFRDERWPVVVEERQEERSDLRSFETFSVLGRVLRASPMDKVIVLEGLRSATYVEAVRILVSKDAHLTVPQSRHIEVGLVLSSKRQP